MNSWKQQEELQRNQLDINLRAEISKSSDSVRIDVDQYKGQQVQVTEKLSEMIKMEVDSRLQTDKEFKNLFQGMIKQVMQEVATTKESTDLLCQKLAKDVKESAQDSAERAHFLSRYIDEEIVKMGQHVTRQVDGIKALSSKLTEQFKKHLINNENMKRDVYKRFEIIEGHLPVYRSELYKLLEANENRAIQKIKEVKDSLEKGTTMNFQAMDERIDKFSELVDINMEAIRKSLDEKKREYANLKEKSTIENEERFVQLIKEVEKQSRDLNDIQAKLKGADLSSGEETGKLVRQLNDLEANLNTSIITEKSVRKAQDKNLAQELDTIRTMLQNIQKSNAKNAASEDKYAQDSNKIAAERQKLVDDEVSSIKIQQKAQSKVIEDQIKKMQTAMD